MGHQSDIRRVLLVSSVTLFGGFFGSIGAFLALERHFGDISHLGVALSLKTLACVVVSWFAPAALGKVSIKSSFLIAEVVGLASTAIILVGFKAGCFEVVLSGMMLSCVPLVVGNLLLRSCLRTMTGSEESYRRHSGMQTVVIGLAFTIAATVVPLLLREGGVLAVFAIDGLSYVVSIASFLLIRFPGLPKFGRESLGLTSMRAVWSTKRARSFLCNWFIFGSLAALIPILASHETDLTKNLPLTVRQNLWAIEGITLSLSGVLYAWSKAEGSRVLAAMTFCSAVWLCLAVYAAPFLQVGLILFFGLASKYAAIKLSNDFVLSAANCARSALAHASFGSVVNHITSTISPLVLVQVVEWKALTGFLFVILAIEALRFSFTHMRPGDAALEAG
jgi:hypothetical protein